MDRPLLVLVAGPAASGKTTLAHALAVPLAAQVADLDPVTLPIVRAFRDAHPDLDEAAAHAGVRDERYRELARHVSRMASSGGSVIAVAPFSREISDAAAWQHWVDATGWPVTDVQTVVLELEGQERYRRMAERAELRDEAALAAGPEAVAPPALVAVPYVRIPAERSLGEQVDLVLQRFGNGTAPSSGVDREV